MCVRFSGSTLAVISVRIGIMENVLVSQKKRLKKWMSTFAMSVNEHRRAAAKSSTVSVEHHTTNHSKLKRQQRLYIALWMLSYWGTGMHYCPLSMLLTCCLWCKLHEIIVNLPVIYVITPFFLYLTKIIHGFSAVLVFSPLSLDVASHYSAVPSILVKTTIISVRIIISVRFLPFLLYLKT